MSIYGEPEIYSRFLRKSWIKENNTRIHLKAYLPTPIENQSNIRLEVSCFETQTLVIKEIIQIALTNNILPNRMPPVGHCSINEGSFLFGNLTLDRNYIPDRHIDIIGWESYQSKEDRNEIASKLAELGSDNIYIYE